MMRALPSITSRRTSAAMPAFARTPERRKFFLWGGGRAGWQEWRKALTCLKRMAATVLGGTRQCRVISADAVLRRRPGPQPQPEHQRAGQQDQEQPEQVMGRYHGDLDAERQPDQAHLGEAAGRVGQHRGVEVEA